MSHAVETAAAIGTAIARRAVWSDGVCSWVGAVPAPPVRGRPGAPTAAALGPDLYAGTAGVALYLAHLYRRTSDPLHRRTALGAIGHALRRGRALPPARTLAHHTGRLGISVTAARCAPLLDEPALIPGARALLADGPLPPDPDLLSGVAGTACGLVELAAVTGDGGLRDRAVALAPVLAGSRPALTGMAHGTAGIVHALLELHAVSGLEGLRVAAAAAARREDALFDPGTANWPDLRPDPDRDGEDPRAESAMGWCHGAPGIVLSRRLDADAPGPRLRAGGDTAARWAAAAIATGRGNLSLCHGLTGVVECLRDGMPGPDAEALVAGTVDRIRRHRGPWPCGIDTGETPGLFLGVAGIGLFLLRCGDDRVPNVLAPGGGVQRPARMGRVTTRRTGAPRRT